MFTFDGWVTRVAFELHWALETRLHASALDSELTQTICANNAVRISTLWWVLGPMEGSKDGT